MKRTYSDATTYESQSQSQMSYAGSKLVGKRRRTLAKRKFGFSRSLAVTGRNNSCVIPCTVDYDLSFAADPAYGFSFGTNTMYINGASAVTIPGTSDIAAVFDLVRIAKIEVTILPGQNFLGYGSNSVGTGTRNIPWLYTAFDPNDDSNPSLDAMHQLSTCKTHLMDKAIRRTIYPRLRMNNYVDVSSNVRNQFVGAGSDSLFWFGFKLRADVVVGLTYDNARVSFKVFYECRQSK